MRMRRTRRASHSATGSRWIERIPLAIFAVIVAGGAVLFGAVDRWVQLGLVGLLTLGVFLRPAALLPGGAFRRVAVAVVVLLLAKEFLPAVIFGGSEWRSVAEGELGLRLPWTHHPEPVRALDGLLVLLMAAVWFQWVRRMAADREQRMVMMWILFSAGALMAAVCFLGKASAAHPTMIFGIRETPGWVGWGPFPNRNHTACFLAMAILTGLGCVCWGFARRRKKLIVVSICSVLVMVGALLDGKSRGGLVALAAGVALFAGMVLARRRDRRTLFRVVAGLAVMSALVAAFGASVIERFTSQEAGAVSNNMRIGIWKNAAAMWMDAPVLGHGVETFTQVFPLYQRLELDGQSVLHPESSWLLWLNELGMVPLAFGMAFLGVAFWPALRTGFAGRSSFYLFAGGVAAVAAWLVHCVIDVPGHRWGTAGFALAALALVCPAEEHAGGLPGRAIALVPAAVAAFWVLPFLGTPPPWSPVTAGILRDRDAGRRSGPLPASGECEAVLRHFPLNVEMHQVAGIARLSEGRVDDGEWQRHFEAVQRLAPAAWNYLVTQARATMGVSPRLGIHYWQMAVERAGRQREEMVRAGLIETSHLPVALSEWDRFIRARPELALAYVRALIEELRQPREAAREYFDLWWEKRSGGGVSEVEIADFNSLAQGWVDGKQMEEWIRRHADRRRRDFRVWVAVFHKLGADQRAWELYAGVQAAPGYPGLPRGVTREQVEANWKISKDNPAHARTLAEFYERAGELALMREVVLEVSSRENPPLWFVQKAAHVLAADGRIAEAVAMALRDK